MTSTASQSSARSSRTPAQLYSLIFGATLLLAGALGFLVDSNFSAIGPGVQGSELIVFEVNGWHNVVHLLSGALGLALAGSAGSALAFAFGFGGVYLLVTIWGFIVGDHVLFGLLPVNTADNFLHLAISLTGIAAGFASLDSRRRPA